MYSIGEFSRTTGLTVKALRHYHDQEVLVPSYVDSGSGYRYYHPDQIDTAIVISKLKGLGFSLKEIADIIRQFDDEADILDAMERRLDDISRQMQHLSEVRNKLKTIIQAEREGRKIMSQSSFDIVEKTVEPMLVAGVRMKGRYQECGKAFGKIGRYFGSKTSGKPMILYHDGEYKEEDADFEPCIPIRKGESKEGVVVRELPGGRCITLIHQGPYDTLHRSYKRILSYLNEQSLKPSVPSREVYIKGPGMIFRGNPAKYLTEIQMFVDGSP